MSEGIKFLISFKLKIDSWKGNTSQKTNSGLNRSTNCDSGQTPQACPISAAHGVKGMTPLSAFERGILEQKYTFEYF